jgi:uncharacterized membrane protein
MSNLQKVAEKALTDIFIDSTFWPRYWHCHKIPRRSFFINGRQFHICARCTGIAFGGMLAPVILLLPQASPGILGIAPLALVVDGLSQAMGLRESKNWLRFATGFLTVVSLLLLIKGFFLWYGRRV